MSCRNTSLTPRMRPSRVSAISASWICPRSCVVAKKCSWRSSIHLTGRSSRMAAQGSSHLLRIEQHDLRPEAAADERRDHPHLALAEAQHAGEPVAQEDRRLGGVPHGELAGARIPAGHDAARLDRRDVPWS